MPASRACSRTIRPSPIWPTAFSGRCRSTTVRCITAASLCSRRSMARRTVVVSPDSRATCRMACRRMRRSTAVSSRTRCKCSRCNSRRRRRHSSSSILATSIRTTCHWNSSNSTTVQRTCSSARTAIRPACSPAPGTRVLTAE